jgi:L-asparaginase
MAQVPVLIIHGGAGKSPANPKILRALRAKIRRVLRSAYARLLETNAVEAVCHAVELLENDPHFNAGRGSYLQADGKARLTASVMDGADERFAAVLNLERVANPVRVARLLLEEKDRVLAGPGAFRFAREKGFRAADTRTARAVRRWKQALETGSDTVGACALDRFGNLASATSTGGRGMERPGRVSDSGMPAANFADSFSAVSATGIGEEIIEQALAAVICARARDGRDLKRAFSKTFSEVRRKRRRIGAVGLDRHGNICREATTELLIFGWKKGKKIQTL